MTTQKNDIQTIIKLYRSVMTEKERRITRNRKPRPFTYPIGIERYYTKKIVEITSMFINKTMPYIKQFLSTHIRLDSIDNDLDMTITAIIDELILIYGVNAMSSGNLGTVLTEIAESVLGKNSSFFQKQIKIVTGTPLSISTPWWPETKALWERENYELIKGLGEEYIKKINHIIIKGVQEGTTMEGISMEISKVSEQLTGYRSRLIARDQIGKLNSLISKSQMTSIGIETYYWITAMDERVRGDPAGIYKRAVPSHYDMSDLLMSWDNPTVYSDDLGKTWKKKTDRMEPLHAGMAILCRCVSAPSWNDYLQALDEGLA